MNIKREIIFLNENYDLREFDVFINGKKVSEERDIYKRKHAFKAYAESDMLNVIIRQRHPCESISSMIFESMGQLLLDFLYESGEDREARAIFECEIGGKCDLVSVELLRKEEGKDSKYMFNVFSDNGDIKEIRNEFESPVFLKRRIKIFKWLMYLFPALIPIIFLVGVLLITI